MMEFRIADTFTDSLAKLSTQEQKAAKTTAFDLQLNPAHPGLKFHKVEYGKDPNFWSVRVSGDVRMIVHRSDGNLLLCYVDHHEEADHISIGTMHLAKGLEFRAVAAMACDDEIIPLQSRMESVADNNDLEDIYNTERHLLYVACTRAREYLLVSGVEPVSEFLDDIVILGQ